jgi:hypothetical protein
MVKKIYKDSIEDKDYSGSGCYVGQKVPLGEPLTFNKLDLEKGRTVNLAAYGNTVNFGENFIGEEYTASPRKDRNRTVSSMSVKSFLNTWILYRFKGGIFSQEVDSEFYPNELWRDPLRCLVNGLFAVTPEAIASAITLDESSRRLRDARIEFSAGEKSVEDMLFVSIDFIFPNPVENLQDPSAEDFVFELNEVNFRVLVARDESLYSYNLCGDGLNIKCTWDHAQQKVTQVETAVGDMSDPETVFIDINSSSTLLIPENLVNRFNFMSGVPEMDLFGGCINSQFDYNCNDAFRWMLGNIKCEWLLVEGKRKRPEIKPGIWIDSIENEGYSGSGIPIKQDAQSGIWTFNDMEWGAQAPKVNLLDYGNTIKSSDMYYGKEYVFSVYKRKSPAFDDRMGVSDFLTMLVLPPRPFTATSPIPPQISGHGDWLNPLACILNGILSFDAACIAEIDREERSVDVGAMSGALYTSPLFEIGVYVFAGFSIQPSANGSYEITNLEVASACVFDDETLKRFKKTGKFKKGDSNAFGTSIIADGIGSFTFDADTSAVTSVSLSNFSNAAVVVDGQRAIDGNIIFPTSTRLPILFNSDEYPNIAAKMNAAFSPTGEDNFNASFKWMFGNLIITSGALK